MERVFIGNNLNKVCIKPSLSEKRYKAAMKRKYKTDYSLESEDNSQDDGDSPILEAESLAVPPELHIAEDEVGDKEERSEERYFGKDVVIKPLAYYTIAESLKHALNDYREQIARTTKLVMAKRSKKYGQRLATLKDKDDVLGEYPESSTTETIVGGVKSGAPELKVKRHYFTRPIDGIMYRIVIDEDRTGIGSSKRNTYMLVDIAVIFYRKDGIGLGKEIILRSKILRFRKRAPHSSE